MWYLMRTIKMEDVCWADNRIIDMYWAISYVKQNGATSLTKGLSGARLALLQPWRWLPRAAFGKTLHAARAAFHLKWLLALSSLRSESRPAWNKLFSFPSQFGPDWIFSHPPALAVPTPDPSARLTIPLSHVPCPVRWHFGPLALFTSGILDSVLYSPLHTLYPQLGLVLVWLLTYRFCLLFLVPGDWYSFSGFLFGSIWLESDLS